MLCFLDLHPIDYPPYHRLLHTIQTPILHQLKQKAPPNGSALSGPSRA